MTKYSEAQRRATQKYRSQFSNIQIRVTAEEKTEIERRASDRGLSITQYVKECALQPPTQ